MAGTSIRVEINDAEARRNLDDLLARMGNPRPFFESVGIALVGSTLRRFKAQVRPDGAPWTPLKPATIKARQKRGRSAIAILRESGDLAGSIISQVEEDGVRIGSAGDIPYARIHQSGGTVQKPARPGRIFRRQAKDGTFGRRFAKRKLKTSAATEVSIPAHSITIPARPFLGVSAEDETEIIGLARRWLGVS